MNNTKLWKNEKDQLMIKVNLHGTFRSVNIKAMIDSGATEDYIDKRICDRHWIPRGMSWSTREIYLANGNLGETGPLTHIAEVPIKIGDYRELPTLPVANLQNHEIILGIPGQTGHNSKTDREEQPITLDSQWCIMWSLDKSATIYAVPETKAPEENLITRISEIQTEDPRLPFKRLTTEARIPTKRSTQAAGHDLYARETKSYQPRGRA